MHFIRYHKTTVSGLCSSAKLGKCVLVFRRMAWHGTSGMVKSWRSGGTLVFNFSLPFANLFVIAIVVVVTAVPITFVM